MLRGSATFVSVRVYLVYICVEREREREREREEEKGKLGRQGIINADRIANSILESDDETESGPRAESRERVDRDVYKRVDLAKGWGWRGWSGMS